MVSWNTTRLRYGDCFASRPWLCLTLPLCTGDILSFLHNSYPSESELSRHGHLFAHEDASWLCGECSCVTKFIYPEDPRLKTWWCFNLYIQHCILNPSKVFQLCLVNTWFIVPELPGDRAKEGFAWSGANIRLSPLWWPWPLEFQPYLLDH